MYINGIRQSSPLLNIMQTIVWALFCWICTGHLAGKYLVKLLMNLNIMWRHEYPGLLNSYIIVFQIEFEFSQVIFYMKKYFSPLYKHVGYHGRSVHV